MREDLAQSAFPPIRAITTGLVWLAVFALLYTVGVEIGAWPDVSPGRLRDLDLVVGFFAGAAVLLALLAPGRANGVS